MCQWGGSHSRSSSPVHASGPGTGLAPAHPMSTRLISTLPDEAPGLPEPSSKSLRQSLLTALVLTLLFALLLISVLARAVQPGDRSLELAAHHVWGPLSYWFFQGVTFFGSSIFRIPASSLLVVLLALRRRIWGAAFLGLAQAGSVLGEAVKDLVHRPRPALFTHGVHAGGYSFPSGHSMGAMLFWGALGYLLLQWKKGSGGTWFVTLAFGLMIVLVGLSRVVLGVHYPSDVLGGFLLGGMWLGLCHIALRRWLHAYM